MTSAHVPPFDPELAAALPAIRAARPDRITAETIPAVRQGAPGAPPPPSDAELSRGGAFRIETHDRLLLCLPTGGPAPVPVVYFIHGGGMITGSNRLGIDQPLDWAAALGFAVVSVAYRLAPEHPYPAGLDDCYAGLRWVAEQADDLGVDPDRVVIAGASAGGGLAAAVALLARDRGGPALAGQVLMSPMLDDRNDSVSARQMEGLGVWDRTANDTGWTALLGAARSGADVPAYAAPARATDLSGLPPAYIDAGSAETYRDEDVAYASAIWAAGGRAELHVWPGGFHGFDGFVPRAALSRDARAARLAWLRRLDL
jgi:acetyl esterase/lipase